MSVFACETMHLYQPVAATISIFQNIEIRFQELMITDSNDLYKRSKKRGCF